MNGKYTPHETFEVHEMAAFKTVCLTKSKTMQLLVADKDLKNILQQDAQISTRQLQELNGILSKVRIGG
jgi:similar to spore coat protein